MVVGVLEVVGADVGDVAAVEADDAEVDERTAVGLHDAEDGGQPGGIGQLAEAVGLREIAHLGDALREEGVDGADLAHGQRLDAAGDLFRVHGVDAVDGKPPERHQRGYRQ